MNTDTRESTKAAPVWRVRVGTIRVGITASAEHADELVRRYLATCWPKANPVADETYQYGSREERWHAIPAGEYSGGEYMLVQIEKVEPWTPARTWPQMPTVSTTEA